MEEKEYKEYIKDLVILAEEDDADALHSLWNLLDKGCCINNTSEWEYRWYLVLATKYSDSQAMMYLYELYMNGIYVDKNEEEAIKWLTKASECFDTCALREIINYYFSIKNYGGVIIKYQILLDYYLHECTFESALENSFYEINEECIEYIKNNYKGF